MVGKNNQGLFVPGDTAQADVTGKAARYEAFRSGSEICLGIDIGSTSSDIVLLDGVGKIIWSDYKRTRGRPIETVYCQLQELFGRIKASDISISAATGSVGRLLAGLCGITFINEVPAQVAAIGHLYPEIKDATIIEMGGQDSKLIFITRQKGSVRLRDFALNTVCAAGTGSFLDQQAQRLGIDIEKEFGRLALESVNVPRMAGRCSVFAKSDMIHLQQQATPVCDILAGLCLALASNLKSNLGCGREFVKPIVFTGGVAANIGVVRAMEQVFDLEEGGLIVPPEHFFTGAIGAVLVAKSQGVDKNNVRIDLSKIDDYLRSRGDGLWEAPRREVLAKPTLPVPQSKVYEDALAEAKEPIKVYLGVDVGSISTNVAIIDDNKRVLAKAYLMTAGRPLEAVRQGMQMVGVKAAGKVQVAGAATTGSGRYLTGDFIGADVVINEITAQAAGAAIVNPKVDTIFEIGGQDSKYISLENGVVVDFEMNHACAAGTGSFLEEQAQRLGININGEFAELALKSESPIKLGERCTVFMESDLLSYQQQGAQTPDLVAGLSYSIVSNYLNRVVGRRKIGNNICFQGGTAFNKAVWSAFEKVTGKTIMVPDHHEVTGAIGAAAIAKEHIEKLAAEKEGAVKSSFRGFESLISIKYDVESFACECCPNHCEIKKVQLPGSEPLYYGSRCDRYNLKKAGESKRQQGEDAFEYRRRKLFEFAGLGQRKQKEDSPVKSKATIGIPLALVNWQLLPLFSQFFKSLGFEVVISGATDKRIIRMGVESVSAQPCFPVKVAYGHVAELLEKQVDYIFLPSIVSMKAEYPGNEHNKLCPYVQSFVYQARAAFGERLGKTKILDAVMRFGDGEKFIRQSFTELGGKLGEGRGKVRDAMKKGFAAQAEFEKSLKEKGREILGELKKDERLFVLVSRPYNGCDEGVNLRLPKKLADLGVRVIPMEMLEPGNAELSDEFLHSRVYWSYGQKILRAAEVIKNDERLFAIYLSNFSCGPDSFLMTFFKDIMAQKPCLQLELDEHSADAGIITRLEAFLESLKHYCGKSREVKQVSKTCTASKKLCPERTLYIPYMSDCSYGVAASFKAHGQPAEVMPIADETALLMGRRFTSGKECLPCAITTGEMLKVLKTAEGEGRKVGFFMPGGNGPCRFGMYNCMHRQILRYAGVEDTDVLSPDQDGSFYREFAEGVQGCGETSFMKSVWAAAVGIDLMQKIVLRLRPFAADRGQVQRLYETSLKRWLDAVEKRSSLSKMRQLMESIGAGFAEVEVDRKMCKPRIGVVGEIYVRNHPFANMNIVDRLERLGAVCDVAAMAEWIYYTNFTRREMLKRRVDARGLLKNKIQNYFQHRIEKSFAEPLEKKFGPLAEEPVSHVIELAGKYIHHSFEGEAVLSVGKTIEYYHRGFGGVVNVMPFCCMPSTIVSSQTMRISSDCGDMPILNLSFDGQEDPTLTTRLEAFVDQVRQRQGCAVSIG